MNIGLKEKFTFLRKLCCSIEIIIIYRLLVLLMCCSGLWILIYGNTKLETIMGAFIILIFGSFFGIGFTFEIVSESKEFYSRLVRNISIIIRVMVGLFMIPILISIYLDNMVLLQKLGVFNEDLDVNDKGFSLSLFTALTFVGIATYAVSFQKWVYLFVKNIKWECINSIDISFIIWVAIILTNIALGYLDILNDGNRFILTLISFIPMLSDAFIVLVLSLAICLLSMISRKPKKESSPVTNSISKIYSIIDNNKKV